MDLQHFKTKLLQKRQELNDELNRMLANARDSRDAEVQDPIDYVTSSEAQAAAFQISTNASETLVEVNAALQRIEDGTYGICTESGEPIEEARLEAVPWTPYTRQVQEEHDRRKAEEPGSLLESAS
jgi:DnaK suppressor protein